MITDAGRVPPRRPGLDRRRRPGRPRQRRRDDRLVLPRRGVRRRRPAGRCSTLRAGRCGSGRSAPAPAPAGACRRSSQAYRTGLERARDRARRRRRGARVDRGPAALARARAEPSRVRWSGSSPLWPDRWRWRWRCCRPGPGGRPGKWRPFEAGLVVDGLVVRTGFPLRFEPLGRDAPRWRGARRLEPGAAFVVTLERLGRGAPAVGGVGPAGRGRHRGGLAQLAGAARLRRPLPGGGGAQPAGGALPDRTGRGAGWGRNHLAAAPDRQRAQRRRPLGPVSATSPRPPATWAARRFPRGRRGRRGLAPPDACRRLPLPWPGALDADGQPVPELEELSLAGWRRSQPVVVGRPPGLVDLDLYGDVVAAYGASTERPGRRTGGDGTAVGAWPALAGAADWVADHWGEPDAGVWESAGPPALLVASRVQAWFALDRMARLGRAANPLDLQAAAWHQEARQVLAWLEADGAGGRRAGCAATARPAAATNPTPPCCGSPGAGPWPPPIRSWPPPWTGCSSSWAPVAFLYRYPPAGRRRPGRARQPRSAGLAVGRPGPGPSWAAGRRPTTAWRRWWRSGGAVGLLAEAVDPCPASCWATCRRRRSTWRWWTPPWPWPAGPR